MLRSKVGCGAAVICNISVLSRFNDIRSIRLTENVVTIVDCLYQSNIMVLCDTVANFRHGDIVLSFCVARVDDEF